MKNLNSQAQSENISGINKQIEVFGFDTAEVNKRIPCVIRTSRGSKKSFGIQYWNADEIDAVYGVNSDNTKAEFIITVKELIEINNQTNESI